MKLAKVLLWILAIVGAIVGVLYLTVFDVYVIPGDDAMLLASIAPTLSDGDVLVILRRTGGDRGNLLRCPDPRDGHVGGWVIARAIATGGESLDVTNDTPSIDRHTFPSLYGCDPATVKDPRTGEDVALGCQMVDTGDTKFAAYGGKIAPNPTYKTTVPRGTWFLMSDDRHIYLDSRDYGAVDAQSCQRILARIESKAGWGDSEHRMNFLW
jgi:signal peptidase I